MNPNTAFRYLTANRKARAAEAELTKAFVVRRLTKAGEVNKMDEPKGFHNPEEARLHITRIRGYNPGRVLRYTINGEEA